MLVLRFLGAPSSGLRLLRVRALGLLALLGTAAPTLGCQDYPFELRTPQKVSARKINEIVATVRPTDILFVIDNSGTMSEERAEIVTNVTMFVDELLASSTDFQIGIVSTDLDCNLPTYSQATGCGAGGFSTACCLLRKSSICKDEDKDGDGKIDTSNCDGGRLRASPTQTRIFRRPDNSSERAAWINDFSAAITGLDCNIPMLDNPNPNNLPEGSPYEAGLATAVRAVACSVNPSSAPEGLEQLVQCSDPAVAQLNAGFVREGADLVVIFITDEDDCSFANPSYYRRPVNDGLATDQAAHLCSPDECYARYGKGLDNNSNGLMDWSERNPPGSGYFKCGASFRTVNPPEPDDVTRFLDALIALKGGEVSRVRAAGIMSGVLDDTQTLGFRPAACYKAGAPSTECGCLNTNAQALFCELTGLLGQRETHTPPGDPELMHCGNSSSPNGGCDALPSGRYVDFLRALASRREQAGVRSDTLADSICQARYDSTLYRIVNNVILNNCFDLGQVPADPSQIGVRLTKDGKARDLANVEPGSALEGWSYVSGTSQICLEGGLRKSLDDKFEIFFLTSD